MTTATWTAQALWSIPREWVGLLLRLVSQRLMDRFRESAFYGPTIPESIIDNSPAKSSSGNPIGDAQSLAVQGQVMILGCVAQLFILRSPLAIIRRVSFVVIDALDRRVGRPPSHIGQEIVKRHPSFAYRDATSTVFVEVERPRVATPRFHGRPNAVFTRSQSGSITSVLGASLAVDATATLSLTSQKVANKHISVIAAVAATSPKTITYELNNRESAKSLTAVVRGGWMKDWGYSLLSHAVSSWGDDVVRGCGSLTTILSPAHYPIKTRVQVAL